MDIQSIRENYFRKNPNAIAKFVYNERLGRIICFECIDSADTPDVLISDEQVKAIELYAQKNGSTPLLAVVEYLYGLGLDQKLIDEVCNYYIDCFDNGTQFETVQEACMAFNQNVRIPQAQKSSSKKIITANLVDENGNVENFNIFYITFIIKPTSKYGTVCWLEEAFTDEEYRGNGLQTYGIAFLEKILAQNLISTMVGEAREFDAYQSESNANLIQHYQKLGFSTSIDESGKVFIKKHIDLMAHISDEQTKIV